MPADLGTDYHGNTLDMYVEATANVVGFRRHGQRIMLGVTRGIMADLDADQAEEIALNLLAAVKAARAEPRERPDAR
jgi:small-conductance mechanosensitive channel